MKDKQIYVDLVYSMFNTYIILKKAWWVVVVGSGWGGGVGGAGRKTASEGSD